MTDPVLILRLILSASSDRNARALLNRMNKSLGCDILHLSPHRDGGFEARLGRSAGTGGASWPEAVVWAIEFAGRVAHGWTIATNVSEELDMTSPGPFRFAGLSFAQLTLNRV